MAVENILITENCCIGYHPNTVLNTVSITLKKGKLVAIVGENGVGKSTFLKTISGLLKPIEGNIYIHNKPIQQYTALALAQEMSLVLTEKLPPSNLTIYELIALGRQPYTNWIGKLSAADEKAIQAAIALTQIEHLLHKKHYEVSDGQLQIALIARALAQETSLIVLDEPTTHLDLPHKIAVFKLLKKLAHEHQKSIVFSTHDIDLAIQISDEMIVMTSKQVDQDEPCQLIQKGVFNTLFQDTAIRFDETKGRFIVLD